MGIKEIPTFYCQCGCGEVIPPSPRHRYPSKKPSYKTGHAHRNKFVLNRNTIEKEYRELKSAHKVAKKFGVTPVAVNNMLRKIGAKRLDKDELDENNSKLGRIWEKVALKNLEGSIDISGEDWRAPYDIEWRSLRINVKASRPVSVGNIPERNCWAFRTKKKVDTDYFLCFGLDENDQLEKVFWIPASVTKSSTTIRRFGNTKYNKYATTLEQISNY